MKNTKYSINGHGKNETIMNINESVKQKLNKKR